MKKKISIELILKFTLIIKDARLSLKWLIKIIIGDDIIFQKKVLLTEMLYNCEAILTWDFAEMGKIKKKMATTQKI